MKQHVTVWLVFALIGAGAVVSGCSKKAEPPPPVEEKNIEDVVAAARSAQNTGDFAGAVALWSEVLVGLEQLGAGTEDVANTYMMRAMSHMGNEEYEKALADCNMTIKLTPDFAQAYMGRAQIQFYLGNEAEMDADIERAQDRGMDMGEFIAAVEAAGQEEAALAGAQDRDTEQRITANRTASSTVATVKTTQLRPAPTQGLEGQFLAHETTKTLFADKDAPFEPAGDTLIVDEAPAPGDGWYVDLAVPSRSTSDTDDDAPAVTVHMRVVLDELGRMLDSRPMYITNADDTQLESLLDSL